jgi:hypothetical protein
MERGGFWVEGTGRQRAIICGLTAIVVPLIALASAKDNPPEIPKVMMWGAAAYMLFFAVAAALKRVPR